MVPGTAVILIVVISSVAPGAFILVVLTLTVTVTVLISRIISLHSKVLRSIRLALEKLN